MTRLVSHDNQIFLNYRLKVPDNPSARQGKGGVPHPALLRFRHAAHPSVHSFPEPKHRLKRRVKYGIAVQHEIR
jgi:hypothetical protein